MCVPILHERDMRIEISSYLVDSFGWTFCNAAWIVQDVTLFHTVAVFGMTGERASMSNGSLASSRVLNMARSPNAIVYVYVKFSTTVAYPTIQMFEHLLQEFVQSRPREWTNLASFRATRVVADLGFIGKMGWHIDLVYVYKVVPC
jgi:small-conductance mechanosensitive channel